MKNNIKQGFSLGEMVITIGIVGFLAMVFAPMLKGIMPNQEQLMFKKAYSVTERIVYELINDEDYYPDVEGSTTKQYFGNTEEITYRGEDFSGNTKFCNLFARKLNKASEISCETHSFKDSTDPVGTVATADGIVWILPISTFNSQTTPATIYVDVNGKKKPNCDYDKATCKKPDRFAINVYQDGRLSVDGIMEREYLNRVEISQGAQNETEEAKNEDKNDNQ